jgi:hypothetical protein
MKNNEFQEGTFISIGYYHDSSGTEIALLLEKI